MREPDTEPGVELSERSLLSTVHNGSPMPRDPSGGLPVFDEDEELEPIIVRGRE
ncbi:hypothetical protein SAMN05421630_102198 [Prauserella marina]|uniref:Uncharacterized protein n=1 Tax=Prauserella marina TaxID=530584 RepID=A0A1G6LSJ8_9PSEU|nr:hypothetical protein [Prauserella marina]PWV85764.1 hypothetical protein DES30_1011794 [Prauserella marina]SDC46161.1 hypothetical protein SAMN05421630_102198 [Prauserella marina]